MFDLEKAIRDYAVRRTTIPFVTVFEGMNIDIDAGGLNHGVHPQFLDMLKRIDFGERAERDMNVYMMNRNLSGAFQIRENGFKGRGPLYRVDT